MEVTSGILIRGFSILAGLAITRIGNKMKVSKVMGDPQVTTAMPQLFQLLSHGCHNWMIWRSPIDAVRNETRRTCWIYNVSARDRGVVHQPKRGNLLDLQNLRLHFWNAAYHTLNNHEFAF